MTDKYLIPLTTLVLPFSLANAQSAAPQGTPLQPQAATPDAGADSRAESVQGTPATEADLAKGKEVKDKAGATIGTIDSTNGSGVVLSVGEKKIQVPKASVGKNDSGLFIPVTKAELEAAAGKRSS